MRERLGRQVGQRIRQLRRNAELTQEELAGLLGPNTSSITVSRYERGVRIPSLEAVDRLATALGTDLPSFFAGLLTEQQAVRSSDERIDLHHLIDTVPTEHVPVVSRLIEVYLSGVRLGSDE